jgi:O-antigen/teichoic acid export membrane protein
MSDLNRFARHTVVYTLGNVLYRGGAFLLLPLYTRLLTPADYGVIDLISITTYLIQTLLSSGIAHATMRFYFEYENEEEGRAVVSTSLIVTFVVNLAVALLLSLTAPFVSRVLFHTPDHALAIRIVWIGMVLEISREICLGFIRAREQSLIFAAAALTQLLTQVGANLITVWYLRMGVLGIFVGNFVAVLSIWTVLVTFTLRQCGVHVRLPLMRPILRYGYPLMLSGIVSAGVQSADRYLLRFFTNLSAVGLYALAAKIASIPTILLVQPFNTSFGAFRFTVMNQPTAPVTYSRVLTYYVVVATFAVLGVTVMSEEMLRLLTGPQFWPSYRLVPLVIIPSLMGGVSYCLQTGIYLQKQTGKMFKITLIGGANHLLMLSILIPNFGVYGAASAGVITSSLMVVLNYIVSQRVYPVPYEFGRLFKVVGVGALLGIVGISIHVGSPWLAIPIKLAIVCSFPLILLAFGLPTEKEHAWLRGAAATLSARLAAG